MDGDDYVYTGKTVAKAYRVYREDCNLDEVYDPQDPPKREVNYWGSVEKAHKSGLLSLQPRENETTTPLQSSVTTTKDSITVFMWRRLRMVECTHRLGVIRKRLVEHGLRSRPVGLPRMSSASPIYARRPVSMVGGRA